MKQYQRMESESVQIESEKIAQLLSIAQEKILDLQQLVDGSKVVIELVNDHLL